MNVSISKRQFSTYLLIVLLLLGGASYGVYYLDSMYAKESARVAGLRNTNKDLLERVEAAKEVATQESEIAAAEALVEAFLPDEKLQSDLIAEIEQLAEGKITINTYGFETTDGAPSDRTQTQSSENVSGVLEFPFTILGSAPSFQSLIEYLEGIEATRRKFQVSSISVQPRNIEGESVGGFSISISIRVFLDANTTVNPNLTNNESGTDAETNESPEGVEPDVQ